jgi:hypothetical protein
MGDRVNNSGKKNRRLPVEKDEEKEELPTPLDRIL